MNKVISAVYEYMIQGTFSYMVIDVRATCATPCDAKGVPMPVGGPSEFRISVNQHIVTNGFPTEIEYRGATLRLLHVITEATSEDARTVGEPEVDKGAKYRKTLRDRRNGDSIEVDVYDVLEAYGVTCPSLAHALKKLLLPGQRGSKGFEKDMREGINSVEQAILLQKWRVDDEQTLTCNWMGRT